MWSYCMQVALDFKNYLTNLKNLLMFRLSLSSWVPIKVGAWGNPTPAPTHIISYLGCVCGTRAWYCWYICCLGAGNYCCWSRLYGRWSNRCCSRWDRLLRKNYLWDCLITTTVSILYWGYTRIIWSINVCSFSYQQLQNFATFLVNSVVKWRVAAFTILK
jgi:hypothetical protein